VSCTVRDWPYAETTRPFEVTAVVSIERTLIGRSHTRMAKVILVDGRGRRRPLMEVEADRGQEGATNFRSSSTGAAQRSAACPPSRLAVSGGRSRRRDLRRDAPREGVPLAAALASVAMSVDVPFPAHASILEPMSRYDPPRVQYVQHGGLGCGTRGLVGWDDDRGQYFVEHGHSLVWTTIRACLAGFGSRIAT